MFGGGFGVQNFLQKKQEKCSFGWVGFFLSTSNKPFWGCHISHPQTPGPLQLRCQELLCHAGFEASCVASDETEKLEQGLHPRSLETGPTTRSLGDENQAPWLLTTYGWSSKYTLVIHPRSLTYTLKKWWLEDDPFLLGFGHFPGVNSLFKFGLVPPCRKGEKTSWYHRTWFTPSSVGQKS